MNVSELLKYEKIKPKDVKISKSNFKDKKINTKEFKKFNSLMLIFSLLGTILIGSGLITISSINLDRFSKILQLIIAFVPLIIAYVLCAYTLSIKNDSIIWRESVGVFIFFAFGYLISLISNLYHLSYDFSNISILCAIASLPFVYILKSSTASLIYLFIVSFSFDYSNLFILSSFTNEIIYGVLLLAILPNYYFLCKKRTNDVFLKIHHWVIPFSLVFFDILMISTSSFIFIILSLSLYSIFTYIGDSSYFKSNKIFNNSYKIIGCINTLSVVFMFTCKDSVEKLNIYEFRFSELISRSDFYYTILFFSIFIFLFVREFIKKKIQDINLLHYLSLAVICFILIELSSNIFIVCTNILILAYSLIKMRDGFVKNNITRMNFGLICILILILVYLLDYDIDPIIKGITFLSFGLITLVTNYFIIKKIRYNE